MNVSFAEGVVLVSYVQAFLTVGLGGSGTLPSISSLVMASSESDSIVGCAALVRVMVVLLHTLVREQQSMAACVSPLPPQPCRTPSPPHQRDNHDTAVHCHNT